jgi:hypothetical protein
LHALYEEVKDNPKAIEAFYKFRDLAKPPANQTKPDETPQG